MRVLQGLANLPNQRELRLDGERAALVGQPQVEPLPIGFKRVDQPDAEVSIDKIGTELEVTPILHAQEALDFEELVWTAATPYFDIRAENPGASFDFLIWNSYGNAAVEVKLAINGRLLARYMDLSTQSNKNASS